MDLEKLIELSSNSELEEMDLLAASCRVSTIRAVPDDDGDEKEMYVKIDG
ncbi:hypothetical protein ACJDT4_08970 [Clostridium neuense]|uniref:Uncharacterized protein n=1 Tax=Clostridium neuense TaxID=1728934 RepID=A0ABW8TFV1_9CLOT